MRRFMAATGPLPGAGALAGVTLALLLAVVPPAAAQDRPTTVLYLNFSDGSESITKADVDDAPHNQTVLGGATPYPAFGWPGIVEGTVRREDIIRDVTRRLHRAFLPYNVVLTTRRPAEGPYTMVMVGGAPTAFGYDTKVAGLAYMDCENRESANVVFAFPTAVRGSLHGLFVTIAQEAAHALGLEHTTNAADIMFPRIDPNQVSFPDRPSAISGERICGRETQNSHQRLLELVGAWDGGEKPLDDGSQPDTHPPIVRFDTPAWGASVRQPFAVRATVMDPGGVQEVVVSAAGERLVASGPPWEWSLAGFPSGPLALTLVARDASGNQASAALEVVVGPGDDEGLGCAVGARTTRRATPAWLSLMAVLGVAACYRRRGRL